MQWPGRKPVSHSPSEETLRQLDEVISSLFSQELSFADWFTRWDSGTTPLVVDRLALSTAGQGPRSRCVPVRVDTSDQPVCLKTLQQYGLTLLRFDTALVATSQFEAVHSDQSAHWQSSIGEALLWGSDRFDRFQTVARWRGEITPWDEAAARSTDSLRAFPGWSTWRFTSATWPDPATSVELGDDFSAIVAGWAIAFCGSRFGLVASHVVTLGDRPGDLDRFLRNRAASLADRWPRQPERGLVRRSHGKPASSARKPDHPPAPVVSTGVSPLDKDGG